MLLANFMTDYQQTFDGIQTQEVTVTNGSFGIRLKLTNFTPIVQS